MKKLILLVGETCVGKDTVANMLPYPKVCSYTTRQIRSNETNGVEHIFISKEEMKDIVHSQNLLAYTKTGDVEYGASEEQLKDEVSIYVINPDGVRWLKENFVGQVELITIGLYLPLHIREERAKQFRSDYGQAFRKRVEDENKDFVQFRADGEFDYYIRNDDSNKTASLIEEIIRRKI